MASGCLNSSNSNPCLGSTVSSNCVKWAGDHNEQFNICTGDNLTEDLESIIDFISTLTTGSGIDLSAVDTTCPIVATALGTQDKTLPNVLQAAITALCQIQSGLTTLAAQVNTPVNYNTSCLSPSINTTQGVLQATIDSLCILQAQVAQITTQINNSDLNTTINNSVGTFLSAAITSCGNKGFTKTGTAADTVFKFTALVPINTVVFYDGPLANFDANGTGLESAGLCGWQVCNGYNGTKDMRGYVPAMATNLPGINSPGALDSRVDPSYNSDASYAANIGEKKGENKHKITLAEIPNVTPTVTVTDPGHNHTQSKVLYNIGNSNPNSGVAQGDGTATTTTGTSQSNISVTVAPFGGDQPSENRQPTIFGVFIKKIS